jgi:hypothetical protein
VPTTLIFSRRVVTGSPQLAPLSHSVCHSSHFLVDDWSARRFLFKIAPILFAPLRLRSLARQATAMSKGNFKHVTGSTNNVSPWSATVLASATSDTDPTLLINFDNAKYVFNVTEGFSRTCIQRKVTTNKLRSVFLSRYSTEACNGMPGRSIEVTIQVYIYNELSFRSSSYSKRNWP